MNFMYRLSKIFFVIFIFNYIWLTRMTTVPSLVNYISVAGFTLTGTFLSKDSPFKGNGVRLNKYSRFWTLFTLWALATGFFVAKDFSVVLNQVKFLVEVLLVMEYVRIVGKRDGSLVFFHSVFVAVSIIYVTSMLTGGIVHSKAGRLYLSETSNPNSDAMVLAFGIYSSLRLLDFKRITYLVPLLSISILELYGIFLTGSRKALLIALFFLVFFFFKIWRIRRELSNISKAFVYSISFIVVIVSIKWLVPVYMTSSASQRMQVADVGVLDRWDIASDALSVFGQHPLLGVGLNNYKFYNSFELYSHSTLPELLAGTGIIGAILFFIPYLFVAKSLIFDPMRRVDRIEFLKLIISLLASSTVMIIPYGMTLSFFSALLFVEIILVNDQKNKFNFNNNEAY